MMEARPQFELLSQVATDGRAMRTGYLELILDDSSASDTGHDRLILNLVAQGKLREERVDYRIYETKLPTEVDDAQRRRVISRLMQKLTEIGVSAFASTFESYEDELKRFGDWVGLAEIEWFR